MSHSQNALLSNSTASSSVSHASSSSSADVVWSLYLARIIIFILYYIILYYIILYYIILYYIILYYIILYYIILYYIILQNRCKQIQTNTNNTGTFTDIFYLISPRHEHAKLQRAVVKHGTNFSMSTFCFPFLSLLSFYSPLSIFLFPSSMCCFK